MTRGPVSRKVARLVYGWTRVSMSRTARLLSIFIRGGFRLAGIGRARWRPRTGGAVAAVQEPARLRRLRGKVQRPTAMRRNAPRRAGPTGKCDIHCDARRDPHEYDPRDSRPSPGRAQS